MKLLSSKVIALGLISLLAACASSSKGEETIDPTALIEMNTAWTLIGNKDLDEAGLGFAISCQGAKAEMKAWFAKNNGCVQYGQFKNQVAAEMEGMESPTDEQVKEAEAKALAMMSPEDSAALKAHCDTMGNEAGGALVKFVAAAAGAVELQEALKGAKDSLTGNMMEKATKGKMFIDGLGQVAEMVSFLTKSQTVINQWTTKYEEWGDAVNEI